MTNTRTNHKFLTTRNPKQHQKVLYSIDNPLNNSIAYSKDVSKHLKVDYAPNNGKRA